MQAGGLLLVGCGKMGSAMLAGWMAAGSAPAPVFVVEPSPAPGAVPAGATCVASADALPAGFAPAVVVLATKPQVMDDVVPAYARFAASGARFEVRMRDGGTVTVQLGQREPDAEGRPLVRVRISGKEGVYLLQEAAVAELLKAFGRG